MSFSFSRSTFSAFLAVLITVNVFLSVIHCAPAPPVAAMKQNHSHQRSQSPRSNFLQEIRPKGKLDLSSGEKQMMDHIYEKRPETPRKQRVHPSKQDEYTLHRQKEQTFRRISGTGKYNEHMAEGSEKKLISGVAAETHKLSIQHGKEADKLIRPASPAKANGGHH